MRLLLLASLLSALPSLAHAAQPPADAEAAVRAQYGDAFMEDVKALKAAEKDGKVDGVKRCMKAYAAAADRDKLHAGKTDAEREKFGVNQEYRACAATCKSVQVGTPESVKPIAARYEATCKGKAASLDSVGHIKRFQTAMARVPGAHGALDLMQVVAEASGALKQAREGKGPDSFPEEAKSLEAVESAHKAELAKARKFVVRPDVVELDKRRGVLRARIEDLEHLGMKKEAEVQKGELRGVEAKWSALAKEAGL